MDVSVYAFQKMKFNYNYKKGIINVPYKVILVDKITSKQFHSYGTFHSEIFYDGDLKLEFLTDLKHCN